MKKKMKASKKIIEFIKKEEGYRNEAYLCSANVWTIGWGHTHKVKKGDVCTVEQAENWLVNDLVACELCVSKYVDIELKQQEFDALVSLVFNVGPQAFINKNKTRTRLLIALNKKIMVDGTKDVENYMLREIKENERLEAIRVAFKSFVFVNNVKNASLVERRDREWWIFSDNFYAKEKMIYAHL